MCLSVAYHFVNESLHGNEIGDSSGDYGRRGFMYQYTSHFYFHSHRESVDGDGIGVHMAQTITSTSQNTGNNGILLLFYDCSHNSRGKTDKKLTSTLVIQTF